MRKYLSLAVLAVVVLGALGAAPKQSNTLELLNQPTYGGEATFRVVLTKRYNLVNSVVWCGQVQDGAFRYIYMNEEWLPNYKNTLDMTFSRGPLQTTGDTYGPWEPSLAAYCSAVVFQDIRNGQHGPFALTNGVNFIVPGVTAN